MKGIEALQAMKEGKIVKDEYGKHYKMENFHILYHMNGEWPSSEMDLNDWMDRNFELSSEPLTYKLTFFEAMCEANQGAIVSNKEYPNFRYIMKDGVLHYYENNSTGSTVSIDVDEMKAKWRVVKEEEE